MALINDEVRALKTILKRIDAGTITTEEVSNRVKVHSLIHKQEKAALQVLALSLMSGMTAKKLTSAGLISKNEIIQTSIPELSDEFIDCPDRDHNITRGECLDISGDDRYLKDCMSCCNFKTTRNMLLPQ